MVQIPQWLIEIILSAVLAWLSLWVRHLNGRVHTLELEAATTKADICGMGRELGEIKEMLKEIRMKLFA